MNMSFKCEIDPSQCIRLLLLVMVVASSQLWMEKEIIEGKVPIDSVRQVLFTASWGNVCGRVVIRTGCVNKGCVLITMADVRAKTPCK